MKELTLPDEKKDLLEGLNPRQIKFLTYYVESGNGAQSYMKAYRTTNAKFASISAYRLLKRLKEVRKALYEQAGLSEMDVVGVLKDAMKAKRQLPTKDGVQEYEDHYARMKAAELFIKFTETDEKQVSAGNQVNVQINANKETGAFSVEDNL